LSRNGFRVNRRGFALIWKSDNAVGALLGIGVRRGVIAIYQFVNAAPVNEGSGKP
jgi:hypothetical protein